MIPEGAAETVAEIAVVEVVGMEAVIVVEAAGEVKINLDERNPREVGGDFSLHSTNYYLTFQPAACNTSMELVTNRMHRGMIVGNNYGRT